ncbi:protein G12-like [Nomia melanderi]|uniref:protein G12-like n=1 Tax=Nomia melanderi TaxID=2448451 RepID=UPI003FCCDE3D
MKFALVTLTVLAVASSVNPYKIPASGSGELAKELQDFLDLVPMSDVVEIVKTYLSQDEEVQAMMRIALSADSVAFIKEIEDMPEMWQLASYIQRAGLDIHLCINKLNRSLKMNAFTPSSTYREISGGISGLQDDLLEVLPEEKLQTLAAEKWDNSRLLMEVSNEIFSRKYMPAYKRIAESNHLKNLRSATEKAGIALADIEFGYIMSLTAHVVHYSLL